MASILQGELAEVLSEALIDAGLPYPMTITRSELSGPEWDPVVTEVQYSCQGWRDQYDLDTISGTLIQATDIRVFIVASTLSITPTTADALTIDGAPHTIVNVSIDPAGAAWDIQART